MTAPGTLQLEHHYAHPPAKVWQALTTPELHAKWWGAGDVRPVVGHRFDLDMGGFGKQPCEVVEVVPEQRFSYRFSVGMLDTLITWTLTPEGQGTKLTLTHEGFKVETPMGKQAYDGMASGWPGVLKRLETVF